MGYQSGIRVKAVCEETLCGDRRGRHGRRRRPILLFGPRLAALGSTGVVSDHVTKLQSDRRVAVVHCYHGDLLLGGALRESGLT